MDTVTMGAKEIKEKCFAIVRFGPETPTGGTRPAEYYQVVIDPEKVSPSGEFIRFGLNKGDEINGWQRISAMTVVEILAPWSEKSELPNHEGPITMRVVE